MLRVRSRPAFTLVESVVVLGVMGVLISSFTLIPRS
ncbi:prepilin-type N-terminal cleavage/methylation domain-containing protein [Weissella confusa]